MEKQRRPVPMLYEQWKRGLWNSHEYTCLRYTSKDM
jgi:hypothetical protein